MTNPDRNDMKALVERVERTVRDHVRQTLPDADVFSFGATDIDPRHLSVWVQTRSDADRKRLLGRGLFRRSPAFADRMRAIVKECGYPADAIPHIGFTVESQETVDRDFAGNWWHRVK